MIDKWIWIDYLGSIMDIQMDVLEGLKIEESEIEEMIGHDLDGEELNQLLTNRALQLMYNHSKIPVDDPQYNEIWQVIGMGILVGIMSACMMIKEKQDDSK